jgi:histidinol phosphatase-like PHP family hydrolase
MSHLSDPDGPTALHRVLDYHVHSNLSECAFPEMSIPTIARRMEELGYEEVGILDHVYSPRAARDLEIKRHALAAAPRRPRIRLGAELCMVRPGQLNVPLKTLAGADFVMIATTHFGLPWIADPPPGASRREIARYVLEMFAAAAELPEADVIAHPLCAFALVGPERPFPCFEEMVELFPESELDRVVGRLAANRIAVEISSKLAVPGVFAALLPFYVGCRDAGVRFAFGSDAHRLESLGMTRGLAPIVEMLELRDEHVWRPRSGRGGGKKRSSGQIAIG